MYTLDRKQILEGYAIRWGIWARSERGIQGYPRAATLHNIIQYGPAGAAAIRAAATEREDDHPIEEAIEDAVSYLASLDHYARAVKCFKAKYAGLIRSKYYTDLPDVEAAKYLGVQRQRYYEEVDRALRFIDGWLAAKKF